MKNLSAAKQPTKNRYARGKHPNSLANLKTGKEGWQKGQSGNPKGRTSKAACITSLIREMLDQPIEEGKPETWRQAIAKAILIGAVTGNPAITKELLERLEGRVTQPIEGGIEITDARNLSEEELDKRIRAELARTSTGKEKKVKRPK